MIRNPAEDPSSSGPHPAPASRTGESALLAGGESTLPAKGERAVECRGLVKRYGALVAVDGLDLQVHYGECFGLLGPNGAGKTTTVEILEGLIRPDGGSVEVLGLEWGADERHLRERIGVQLQETRLPGKLEVEETVRLFASFYRNRSSVERVLETVQLTGKRGSRVRDLSGGQRQRLAVACALVGKPDLLFLDEPTTGLDPQSRRSLWELIERYREDGGTVVLTTHYMEEATRLCDRLAVMDYGQIIAEGTPAELISTLGAEHVIEFTVDDELRLPDDGVLRALPGVSGVRHGAQKVLLTVREIHTAVPALLDRLRERELGLASLHTHHATLEDVFVSLTGRRLRDE